MTTQWTRSLADTPPTYSIVFYHNTLYMHDAISSKICMLFWAKMFIFLWAKMCILLRTCWHSWAENLQRWLSPLRIFNGDSHLLVCFTVAVLLLSLSITSGCASCAAVYFLFLNRVRGDPVPKIQPSTKSSQPGHWPAWPASRAITDQVMFVIGICDKIGNLGIHHRCEQNREVGWYKLRT